MSDVGSAERKSDTPQYILDFGCEMSELHELLIVNP